jgi:Putative addiction module component
MRLQIIQDSSGKEAGVFIPMDDWNKIKYNYPGIDSIGDELPQWQKDLIDERLQIIASNPERLKPFEDLFHVLRK